MKIKKKIEYPSLPKKRINLDIINNINESIEQVNNEKFRLIKLMSSNEYNRIKFYETESKKKKNLKKQESLNKNKEEKLEKNLEMKTINLGQEIKKLYSITNTNRINKFKINNKIIPNYTIDSSYSKISFKKLTKNNFNKLLESSSTIYSPLKKRKSKNFFQTKYSSDFNIEMNKRLNELNHEKKKSRNLTLYNSINSINSFLTIGEKINQTTKTIELNMKKDKLKKEKNPFPKEKTIYEKLSMINILKEKKKNIKSYSYNFKNELQTRKVLVQSNVISKSTPIQILNLRKVLSEQLGMKVKREDNEFKFQKIFKLDTAFKTPKWVIQTRKNHIKDVQSIFDLQNKINLDFKLLQKKCDKFIEDE